MHISNMETLYVSLCLVLALSSAAPSHELPSFLHLCSRSDPELNECVKEAIESLRPHLITGIPELNIPSFEPLDIPEIVINQGTGSVSIKSVYSNVSITGASDFVINSVKIDGDLTTLTLWLPYLHVVSDYKMSGRILMLPIAGRGYSEGNYTDIGATCTMKGEKVKRGGEVYFNITDMFINFNIGHAKIYFDNLFNGDEELGDAMNIFLNDNWRNVANEIKPVLEDIIAEMIKTIANNFYHKHPVDQLMRP